MGPPARRHHPTDGAIAAIVAQAADGVKTIIVGCADGN